MARAKALTAAQRDFMTALQARRVGVSYSEIQELFERRFGFEPTDSQIRQNSRLRREQLAELRDDPGAHARYALEAGTIESADIVEQLLMLDRIAREGVNGFTIEVPTKAGVVELLKKDFKTAIAALQHIREIVAQLEARDEDTSPGQLIVRIVGPDGADFGGGDDPD